MRWGKSVLTNVSQIPHQLVFSYSASPTPPELLLLSTGTRNLVEKTQSVAERDGGKRMKDDVWTDV